MLRGVRTLAQGHTAPPRRDFLPPCRLLPSPARAGPHGSMGRGAPHQLKRGRKASLGQGPFPYRAPLPSVAERKGPLQTGKLRPGWGKGQLESQSRSSLPLPGPLHATHQGTLLFWGLIWATQGRPQDPHCPQMRPLRETGVRGKPGESAGCVNKKEGDHFPNSQTKQPACVPFSPPPRLKRWSRPSGSQLSPPPGGEPPSPALGGEHRAAASLGGVCWGAGGYRGSPLQPQNPPPRGRRQPGTTGGVELLARGCPGSASLTPANLPCGASLTHYAHNTSVKGLLASFPRLRP